MISKTTKNKFDVIIKTSNNEKIKGFTSFILDTIGNQSFFCDGLNWY